jgi:LmbE family N-acetylglucosaminyl deacetylase
MPVTTRAGADPLTSAIVQGMPLLVLSPHLDDAALSCGAMLIHACGRAPVTVATLFTEAPPPPYTLSARRYLRQVGAPDAQTLYGQRRNEDRAALEPLGITCLHLGLTEAQFRLRPRRRAHPRWARLLPELAHLYPVYRLQIVSGRVAPDDAVTMRLVREHVIRLAGRGLVLAPLGVGGHVDHVLVRTAAAYSGAPVVYYSDFPYNLRHRADPGFLQRHGLVEMSWSGHLRAKAALIGDYRTQAHALFPGGQIPLVPESFFFPAITGGVAPRARR